MNIGSEAGSASRKIKLKKGIWIPGVIAVLAIWFTPLPISGNAKHALSIGLLMLLMWTSHVLPHAVTGLIGCYLFWCVVGVPFSTAFGGFAQANAWFVLAASVFGLIATKTRIAHRLASVILHRSGLSYSRLVLGFILTSLLLNFIVPSGIARIIILAGIGIGIVKSKGWEPESVSARGIFIAITISCTLFDKLMITGGSTIVAQSIIEKIGQTRIYWSQWLFAQLPTLLISVPACWATILWLFPGESFNQTQEQPPVDVGSTSGPWNAAEKRCAILLILALTLWATDFIHHIHPSMIALGVALIAVLPGIGVLKTENLREVDFLPFIFTASALSLGDGLVKTGALDIITGAFSTLWRPWAHGFVPLAAALYWTSFAYHLLVPSDPTTLVTSMPSVMNFVRDHHYNPAAAGMIWTLALTGKLFVYQSGVTIVAYSFGYFRARDFLKAGLCIACIEFLVLLLLVNWYWPLIGLI